MEVVTIAIEYRKPSRIVFIPKHAPVVLVYQKEP